MNKSKPQSNSSADDGKVRLQKLLAQHGHGSRRSCEEFILAGRVEVDGQVIKKLGTQVDPDKQKVTFDGERIIQPRLQYFMLNKPPGVVSTAKDPTGRLRVIDLIKTNTRVYNVGRLDKSSEGLILVTNDGDLANRLTHPRYGVEKKYHVLVAGRPTTQQLSQLQRGVYLAEAFVQVSNVRVKKKMRDATLLEIVLDEGRNREIRRLLARIGHKVRELKRVAIGPLALGELPTGSHRMLTSAEIKLLKRFASETKKKPARKATQKKKAVKRLEGSPKNLGRKKKSSRKKSRKKTASVGRARGRVKDSTPSKNSKKKRTPKRSSRSKKSVRSGVRKSRG